MQYLIAFQAQQSTMFYADQIDVSFRLIANGDWIQDVEKFVTSQFLVIQ